VVMLWLPVVVLAAVFISSSVNASFYLPSLATSLHAMWTGLESGTLMADLWYSLGNLLAGLAIAIVVGVSIGLVIGERPLLRQATAPLLDFARATPTVAFIPVIIITLGIGSPPKIFLIFLGTLWPILLNTIAGVASISPAILETARSYRIPFRLRFLKVVLPGAAPLIFAGVRIALAVGVILMVVSEIYGSAIGLGSFILQSGSSFRVADTWGGTILIGIVGYVLSVLLVWGEYLTLGWYFQRAPKTGLRAEPRAQPSSPAKPASELSISQSKGTP